MFARCALRNSVPLSLTSLLSRHAPQTATRTALFRPHRTPCTATPQLRIQQQACRHASNWPNQRPQYQRFGGNKSNSSRSSRLSFLLALLRAWAARPSFYYEIGFLGAGAGAVFVYNLETVPISGRRRFNVVSPAQERQIAGSMRDEVLRQYGRQVLGDGDPRTRMVKRVLDRLKPHTGLGEGEVDWEVFVIDSEEKNAFVVPGGKVFVFTGILDVCAGEDGVTTVLGHELAHVVAHHVAEKVSKNILTLLGVGLVSLLFDVSGQLTSSAFQFMFGLPNSRAQESEADHIGLIIMAKSCYNPDAAPAFWTRMQKAGEKMGKPPEMLSTHPSDDTRVKKITQLLPQAEASYESSDCSNITPYARNFKQQMSSYTNDLL